MTRLLCIVALLTACTAADAEPTLTGLARAKDGDSLTVGNREVRLHGIDAPEWDQTCTKAGKPWACGQAAAAQLAKLVTGKQVRCVAVDTDEHQRTVARCTVGTTDVNQAMVASGYAVAYRHYSTDYVPAEDSAKLNKRGLWAGKFEMPSDYRHAGEAQVEPERAARRSASRPAVSTLRSSPQPSGSCNIKGNQGSNGWIYHLPGMPFYDRTNPEQIFCTEAEARAAGYRRARVR